MNATANRFGPGSTTSPSAPSGAVRTGKPTCAATRPSARLTAARAEALFVSDVSAYARPTPEQVSDAIRRAVRMHGGTRGCAAEMAAAYGEHPETAAPRMRWAILLVASVYAKPARSPRAVQQVPRPRRSPDSEAFADGAA